jgi:hypothetical protein
MKVEEITQAIQNLNREEKIELATKLMPELCEVIMTDPQAMQRMIKLCQSKMQDPRVWENMPPRMRQMMETMMGGKMG